MWLAFRGAETGRGCGEGGFAGVPILLMLADAGGRGAAGPAVEGEGLLAEVASEETTTFLP